MSSKIQQDIIKKLIKSETSANLKTLLQMEKQEAELGISYKENPHQTFSATKKNIFFCWIMQSNRVHN